MASPTSSSTFLDFLAASCDYMRNNIDPMKRQLARIDAFRIVSLHAAVNGEVVIQGKLVKGFAQLRKCFKAGVCVCVDWILFNNL